MKKSHVIASALLIAVAVIATLYWYPSLPESVPMHWGMDGKADDYGPRAILWLLGPGLMAGTLLLGLSLPWLSPKRYEVESFKATYSYFMVVIVGMLGFVYGAVLHAILTGAAEMHRTIPAGVFMLLILMGNSLGKVKRNFFIGVRTPWTLANERVWHATHRLGARLMVGSGLLGMVAVLAGAATWILVVLAGAWAAITVIFSLLYYKRLEKAGQLEAS